MMKRAAVEIANLRVNDNSEVDGINRNRKLTGVVSGTMVDNARSEITNRKRKPTSVQHDNVMAEIMNRKKRPTQTRMHSFLRPLFARSKEKANQLRESTD
jgi:hypothetical protein